MTKNIIGIITVICICCVMFGFSRLAHAETPCDEWANFSKIIAYKWRDIYPRENVVTEIRNTKGEDPEIEVAVFWVNYVYLHKELSPVDVWKSVYRQCNSRATM